MGSVLNSNGCNLLCSLCGSRHGIGSILERHWLLDRHLVRLGMDLGTSNEAFEGAYPCIELRGPGVLALLAQKEKIVRR